MTKLYVGNLPYSFNDSTLKDLFSSYGNVVTASIIIDRQTNRSKGFGFVELEDASMAESSIADLNGKEVEGRNLVVSVARPMEKRENKGFSGGNKNNSRGFQGRRF